MFRGVLERFWGCSEGLGGCLEGFKRGFGGV